MGTEIFEASKDDDGATAIIDRFDAELDRMAERIDRQARNAEDRARKARIEKNDEVLRSLPSHKDIEQTLCKLQSRVDEVQNQLESQQGDLNEVKKTVSKFEKFKLTVNSKLPESVRNLNAVIRRCKDDHWKMDELLGVIQDILISLKVPKAPHGINFSAKLANWRETGWSRPKDQPSKGDNRASSNTGASSSNGDKAPGDEDPSPEKGGDLEEEEKE